MPTSGGSRRPDSPSSSQHVRRGRSFSIRAYGNLRTCIGFLLGQVVEEVPEAVLDHSDPRYPLTVAVSAHKPYA
jgi:hypothetical protein